MRVLRERAFLVGLVCSAGALYVRFALATLPLTISQGFKPSCLSVLRPLLQRSQNQANATSAEVSMVATALPQDKFSPVMCFLDNFTNAEESAPSEMRDECVSFY